MVINNISLKKKKREHYLLYACILYYVINIFIIPSIISRLHLLNVLYKLI